MNSKVFRKLHGLFFFHHTPRDASHRSVHMITINRNFVHHNSLSHPVATIDHRIRHVAMRIHRKCNSSPRGKNHFLQHHRILNPANVEPMMQTITQYAKAPGRGQTLFDVRNQRIGGCIQKCAVLAGKRSRCRILRHCRGPHRNIVSGAKSFFASLC